MPRYDWEKIRSEYVAGPNDVTLDVLRQKHGCGFSTIKARSSRENWDAQRRQYRYKANTKTIERASTDEAELRVFQMAGGRKLQELGLKSIERTLARMAENAAAELRTEDARKLVGTGAEIERKAAGIADEVEHGIRIVIDERDTRL